MDAINSLIERKWVLPLIALILGLAIGVFFAWIIAPVEWVDGIPEQLRGDLRQDYLRMIIDSYSVNNNADLAVSRYEHLGKYAEDALESLGTSPGNIEPSALQNFRAAVEIFVPELPNQQTSDGSSGGSGIGGIVNTALNLLPYVL
jgi:hypothetical protein